LFMSDSSSGTEGAEKEKKANTTASTVAPVTPPKSPTVGSPQKGPTDAVVTPPAPATTRQTVPPAAPSPTPVQPKQTEGPLLFHFGECTNCHHLLPISTTTEKYFPILSKDPKKPVGLGEKCMRCGADSWVLVTG
jgi:hypothetical protein